MIRTRYDKNDTDMNDKKKDKNKNRNTDTEMGFIYIYYYATFLLLFPPTNTFVTTANTAVTIAVLATKNKLSSFSSNSFEVG